MAPLRQVEDALVHGISDIGVTSLTYQHRVQVHLPHRSGGFGTSLEPFQEAWLTVKGLADSPGDAAEWSGRKPDGKVLRWAALQRAMSHADADARAPAFFATLEADAKGVSSQEWSACRPCPLVQLRRAGARPCAADLAAVEFCISAHLRLGKVLFAGQD